MAWFDEKMGNKKINMGEVTWFLKGAASGGENMLIPLEDFPFLIGRGPECSLQLPGKHVSKRHAEISGFGSTLTIRDLNSTNGTMVNGQKLADIVSLKSGDLVTIGGIELQLHGGSPDREDDKTVVLSPGKKTDDFFARYKLTGKEQEVMGLLAKGKAVPFIAETLGISKGTVKNHILEIYKKTGVHARYELVELYRTFSGK